MALRLASLTPIALRLHAGHQTQSRVFRLIYNSTRRLCSSTKLKSGDDDTAKPPPNWDSAMGELLVHPTTREEQLERDCSPLILQNDLQAMFSQLASVREQLGVPEEEKDVLHHLKDGRGYVPRVGQSRIPEAGLGVFLDGVAKRQDVVAIYPGVLFEPGDPVFFPSLRNNYILRLNDGSTLDGKHNGLSGWLYRSIASRDKWLLPSDASWQSRRENVHMVVGAGSSRQDLPRRNPYSVGHLINHPPEGKQANVAYIALNIPPTFTHLDLIPNVHWNTPPFHEDILITTVVLIALRDIQDGEELYVNYCFVGDAHANTP